MPRVLNETKGTVVAERVKVADTLWSRFWGLMGRRTLPPGEGLLLSPTAAIHTAFMRFPIDAVFIDGDGRVVKVVSEMRPFRAAAALAGARSVLEVPAGAAGQARIEQGDLLVVEADD